jgi:hypothetical protein
MEDLLLPTPSFSVGEKKISTKSLTQRGGFPNLWNAAIIGCYGELSPVSGINT